MEKKLLYLTALVSVMSLQTMYSAYRVNQNEGLALIEGKDGTEIHHSEISPGKGPVIPMANEGIGRIEDIKKAIDTLNEQTGSNLKLNCFSGTRNGPVGPNEVVLAKFKNPTYRQGMVGAGENCYLVAVPFK